MVAKKYNQLEGIDYFDTCYPVAKLTTIHLLLSLVVAYESHIH